MTVSLPASRHARWLWLALACIAALIIFVPLQSVHAQAPTGKNVLVRNDGTTLALKKSNRTVSPSHAPLAESNKIIGLPSTGLRNLPPLGASNPESVIGPDGRTQVTNTSTYPSSAIAQLEVDFPGASGICTGWFIDAYHLATAAHCLYDSSVGGFATTVTVYPGRNGATEPYGHFFGHSWTVLGGWISTASPNWDYGVIELTSPVGNTVGWFGYGWNSDNSFLQNRKISVRGYPGDKSYGTSWTMKGPIQQVQKKRFFYSIDTFGGQSGSPAYGKWGKNCNPCSFGVHTYGVGGNWSKNSATRITKKVFKFFESFNAP